MLKTKIAAAVLTVTATTPLIAAQSSTHLSQNQTEIGCLDSVVHKNRTFSERLLSIYGPVKGTKNVHPWPFAPLSIGHTNASYQYYGGEPYFHHGLDIRGAAGTDVIASAGGKVANIENYVPGNPAYWEVAILDNDGYLWQYHHVDRNSIPESIWELWRRGGTVDAGTKIGEIYRWSVSSFGERYDHVHLNVLGENGAFLSPFMFLDPLPDDQGPVFINYGVMKNGRAIDSNSVKGKYTLFATIHDLILHRKYVVPPHRIEIAIDGGEPQVVWDFSTLPGGSDVNQWVHDFFNPTMTCGDYTCRKLTIDLGFVNGIVRRTMPTEPGPHHAVVTAVDFEGNSAEQIIEWNIAE